MSVCSMQVGMCAMEDRAALSALNMSCLMVVQCVHVCLYVRNSIEYPVSVLFHTFPGNFSSDLFNIGEQ